MTTGLEELIAGISRSPRSASVTTPKATSIGAIAKITKANLVPPSMTQSTQEQEEDEPEADADEHKHSEMEEDEPETKEEEEEAPTTPPTRKRTATRPPPAAPRKAKRHLRQEQEHANTEFSQELLEKQFPESRIKRIIKRGGATSCIWKIENDYKLGIKDVIRLGILARSASMLTKCVEFSTQKQYDRNGDPAITMDKDDPSKIADDATTHNFKIQLKDIEKACSQRAKKLVYSDILFAPPVYTSTTKKEKDASASSADADDDHDEKENQPPPTPASKKQKV